MEKLIYLIKKGMPIKLNATEQDKNTNHNTYLLEEDYYEDWRDRKVVDGKLVVDLEEQLAQAKESKLRELKDACNSAIRSGFYIDDKYYQSDLQDQQNLVETASEFLNGSSGEPYESGLKDGLYPIHTKEQFEVITNGYKNHKMACMFVLSQLRVLVANASTTQEVEELTYEINILQG